ncbi:MAG: T9SS type A sorting domain-containing protein [Flavipsychrobacter sp.]
MKLFFLCTLFLLVTHSSFAQCPAVAPGRNFPACHSQNVEWVAAAGVDHYEWVVDTSSADPTIAGITTTGTSLTLFPLAAGTTYYFHIRSVCGAGSTSNWLSESFTTTCDSLTKVNISETSETTANVNWNVFKNCEYSFNYAVDTVPVPPTDPLSWHYARGLSTTITGLTPNTTYFVFIRDSCGGTFGQWVGNHFQTQPLGVQSLKSGQAQITIYPNPATNVIVVNSQKASGRSGAAMLTDVYGKTIKMIKLNGDKQLIDINGLPSGIYFVRYADEATSQTIKLIKQ